MAVLLLVLGAGGLWLLWWSCGLRGCPDVELLRGYVPAEASVVVDAEGEELTKLYRVRRVIVPLDSLPAHVPAAFVAVEDRDFWEHEGVDWSRVVGAAWENLRSFGIEEGFSTITMQLARNLFPDKLPAEERTLWRKLGEIRVAMAIEERYTKEEILELYVNQIYFGSGAYGIEAAAEEYFGKSASELTLAEAALLAGLPRAPSRLNPRVNPEGARARRDLVLRRMAEEGWIPEEEAARAMAEPLALRRGRRGGQGRAPYFVEEVRRRAEEAVGELLYTGGLTVHTTLDPAAQRAAEEELERQLEAIEAGRYGAPGGGGGEGADGGPARLQGAVVVMEARTGDVLALVGGRDYDDSEYNRAVQARRQPGSAFKPFVYAAALAAGYPTTHRLLDRPLRMPLGNGSVWEPRNYGGGYRGVVTLREALIHSRNVPTVRLAEEVGLARVVATAAALGVDGIPELPAVALGAAEVTLLELVAAYAAFATLGRRPEPRFVDRIEDRYGGLVWSRGPRSERVLEAAVAFLVTDILRDVVDRGTATAVRAAGYRGPAAGKTGTTNDATDVWFVGYTPELVAGVWIGYDRPGTIVRGATGGALAAPVWGRTLRRIGASGGGWAPPPGVERHPVNALGRAVPSWCAPFSAVGEEWFLARAVPWGSCHAGPWLPDSAADGLLGEPARPGEAGPGRPGARDTVHGGRDDGSGHERRPGGDPDRGAGSGRPGEVDAPPPGAREPPPSRRDTAPPDLLGRPAPRSRGRPPPPAPRHRRRLSAARDGAARPAGTARPGGEPGRACSDPPRTRRRLTRGRIGGTVRGCLSPLPKGGEPCPTTA